MFALSRLFRTVSMQNRDMMCQLSLLWTTACCTSSSCKGSICY